MGTSCIVPEVSGLRAMDEEKLSYYVCILHAVGSQNKETKGERTERVKGR